MNLRPRSVCGAGLVTSRKRRTSRKAPTRRGRATRKGKDEAAPGCHAEYSGAEGVPVVRRFSLMKARARQKSWLSDPSKGVKFLQEEEKNSDQRFFAYSPFTPVTEMEENRVFNPYTFIKNIPSQPLLSKPCVREIPVKTRSTPEATLVLDLEETLVYSSLSMIAKPEHTFHICFQDREYKVFLILRPHVKEFLQKMSKHFEIFVYTSAKKEYAEKILEVLDPEKKFFRQRLYREDCCCVLGHYVKDLGILERDLAKTVVLGNTPHTFPYHVMNMIPIKSWTEDKEDRELQKLIPYLEKLSEAADFRPVLKRRTDHLHRLLSED